MNLAAADPRLWNEFESRGAVLVRGAISPPLVDRLCEVTKRLYAGEARAGRLQSGDALHLLEVLAHDRALLELIDLPATLPLVVAALGWNIQIYHSHIDVHPPVAPGPSAWRWHQDGGRQNVEIETTPRPRLSVKVGFFLSDCSQPGRGNMLIVPASHHENVLERLTRLDDVVAEPPGAEPVLASPGDALVFDRRLWHARSDNRSRLTRRAIFCAYTYRWIRPRGFYTELLEDQSLCPIRRQLLGAGSSSLGQWQPTDQDVPLRAAVG